MKMTQHEMAAMAIFQLCEAGIKLHNIKRRNVVDKAREIYGEEIHKLTAYNVLRGITLWEDIMEEYYGDQVRNYS